MPENSLQEAKPNITLFPTCGSSCCGKLEGMSIVWIGHRTGTSNGLPSQDVLSTRHGCLLLNTNFGSVAECITPAGYISGPSGDAQRTLIYTAWTDCRIARTGPTCIGKRGRHWRLRRQSRHWRLSSSRKRRLKRRGRRNYLHRCCRLVYRMMARVIRIMMGWEKCPRHAFMPSPPAVEKCYDQYMLHMFVRLEIRCRISTLVTCTALVGAHSGGHNN